MKNRKIDKLKQMYEEYRGGIALFFYAYAVLGILVFSTAVLITDSAFREYHKLQFELCEEEARNRYSQLIELTNEFHESEFLVSCEMPMLVVKVAGYKGKVTASYKNGRIKTQYWISAMETFLTLLVGILAVAIYIFIVIRIRKKGNVPKHEEEET